MAAVQRIRQGVRAMLAFTLPVDLALADQHLTASQMELFRRLKRSEQQHSLRVLRDVLAQGAAPPELVVAALLHDVGKIHCPLRLWQKTAVVLIRAFAPTLYHRWSDGHAHWQQPFAVYAHHPAWSAELVAAAGASEAALWLIAHHAEPSVQWADSPYVYLLERLQQADDAN
jgi:hypothetical protein